MKRSDGFYWNLENVQSMPKDFVWSSDKFSQSINVRQELAKFNRVRPCNVCMFDVIITTVQMFWKGITK